MGGIDTRMAVRGLAIALLAAPLAFGEPDPAALEAHYQRGVQLLADGQHDEALPVLRGAAKRFEQGGNHKRAADAFDQLRECHTQAGKFAEAEQAALTAVRHARLGYESSDEELGSILENVAQTYFHFLKLREAEPYLKDALAARRERLGPRHPTVGVVLTTLGVIRERSGDPEGAERRFREAVQVFEAAGWQDRRQAVDARAELGKALVRLNRHVEAEALLRPALERQRKIYGDNHENVCLTLQALGSAYRAAREYEHAETLHREAFEIGKKVLSPNGGDLHHIRADLAITLRATKKYADAERLYRENLKHWANRFGPNDPDLPDKHWGVADMCFEQGKFAAAEPHFVKVWEARSQFDLPEDRFALKKLARRCEWLRRFNADTLASEEDRAALARLRALVEESADKQN